ncbi:MAG: KpsF/GutQ family sugar-phosphate isomerase [Gemmatimonadaceae bacterium]|nr:KpsF/GutQ family sugar-phosphate isomerase [Gemmatimonadaceae bacterium]
MTDAILERARRVLAIERDALDETARRLTPHFADAVRLIAAARGRLIVSGVGKSGLIGRKMAATFTSTGTPAMFLHPVDSVHGDLGIVGADDVVILISKSGETIELLQLLEPLARLGVRTIAMTADGASRLARAADLWLDIWVREEACPHDLAPTTSTTVTLALGDALAVALLQERGFQAADFARLHPGGALGRKLLTRVRDVMETAALPIVAPDATMREAVVLLAARRGLATDAFSVPVREVMNRTPKLAQADELGSAVVHRLEQHGIMAMPVLDADAALVGVVHLHDLLRAGAA